MTPSIGLYIPANHAKVPVIEAQTITREIPASPHLEASGQRGIMMVLTNPSRREVRIEEAQFRGGSHIPMRLGAQIGIGSAMLPFRFNSRPSFQDGLGFQDGKCFPSALLMPEEPIWRSSMTSDTGSILKSVLLCSWYYPRTVHVSEAA